MNRLGIIDWGIGGIGIYKLVREQVGVPVTYLSDTGVTPYGRMSRTELIERLNDVIRHVKALGVTHLVIGCNAASTAIPFLDAAGLKVMGVIEPAVEMTAKLKPDRLGLIGGRRTVVSGVYRKAFAEHKIDVRQRIAQPLSALIESGDVSSPALRQAAERIVSPLRNCSHILLACTHYPAILSLLQESVPSDVKFINPASALVKTLARWKLAVTDMPDIFLTTGNPVDMKTAARNAFGVEIQTAGNMRI